MPKSSKSLRRRARSTAVMHPPTFTATPLISQRFRFVAVSNRNQFFYFGNLCYLLCRATSSTTILPFFSCIRVKSFEMWASAETGVTKTVLFRGYASQASTAQLSNDEIVLTDTAVGTAQPAHVKWVPARNTALGNFHGSGSTFYAMSITAPVGTVLDIVIEGRPDLPNNGTVVAGAFSLSAGSFYTAAPDLSLSNWVSVNTAAAPLA
jgi:hypothetical protein